MAVGTAATLATDHLVLDRYRPLRPLGSGGSGSVWLAWDEVAQCDVALKIVHREGKAAERAEREVAAAANLRHERCLRAHALAHDDDHVYIVYEYVEGRTVREALRAGELDDRAAVEVAAQTLDGLAHAHERGIVHRDIKPSNVLLADGDSVSVRLLDFGLAQFDRADTLTAAGDVPGTLAYIAPERLAGEPATAASDVWSVGVLLWEALAGGHPFWRPSLLESARAIEAGAASLASVRPDLPPALIAAVDTALALDPRRRPTAVKLGRVLRECLTVRRRRRSPRGRIPNLLLGSLPLERLLGAAAAAIAAGAVAAGLPFFPGAWTVPIGLLVLATWLAAPRVGLAAALAIPVLPLGNHGLGLALAYVAFACVWFALFAPEPHGALFAAAGPLLGPLGALAVAPALVWSLRSGVRRAAATVGIVASAAVVAALNRSPLPLTGDAPPARLGIAQTDSPRDAAGAVAGAAVASGGLILAAGVLAVLAALLPAAAGRGSWAVAALGSSSLALVLLGAPGVDAAPAVVGIWVICAWAWYRCGDGVKQLAPLLRRAGWPPRRRPVRLPVPS